MLKECFDKYAPADMESVSGREIREGKNALMSMIDVKPRTRSIRKMTVVLPIAAAMLAAGTVTAGAASNWDFEKLITGFFPMTANDSDSMDDAVQKLDGMLYEANSCVTSSTFENYDVTMSDYIFNGKMLMFNLYIKAKDGTPFINVYDHLDDPSVWESYDLGRDIFTIDGEDFTFGGGIDHKVLEDGTLCKGYKMRIKPNEEITEPTKIIFSVTGLTKHCHLGDGNAKKLAVDESKVFSDGEYYVLNENGEKEQCLSYKSEDGTKYYIRMSDYSETLDNGTFTAEMVLNPVGEAKPFTISDGKNSAEISISASYAEVSLKNGKTAGGEDGAFWAHIMNSAMFIYDTDGSVMLCPDDFDTAFTGGAGMESSIVGLTKLIDVEKIGAIRIGAYTCGDVPAIDYEKYPYIRDYYGIIE